jgi:hypothetical protein
VKALSRLASASEDKLDNIITAEISDRPILMGESQWIESVLMAEDPRRRTTAFNERGGNEIARAQDPIGDLVLSDLFRQSAGSMKMRIFTIHRHSESPGL